MTIDNTDTSLLGPMRKAMYDWSDQGVQTAVSEAFHDDALVQLAHPFETLDGADGFRLDGVTAGDFSGYAVSGAGDSDVDGAVSSKRGKKDAAAVTSSSAGGVVDAAGRSP